MEKIYVGAEGLIDFVLHGEGNAVVDAVAGAGKSTTIRNGIKLLPKNNRVLLVSFNKKVAEDNQTAIGDGYPNVDVRTMHSMGLRVLQENLKSSYQDDDKYIMLLKHNLYELTETSPRTLGSFAKYTKYVDTLEKLFQLSRSNFANTLDEIEKIADKYELPISADECETALAMLRWGKEHTETYDYTDMIWLPVVLGLTTSRYKYDYIFIDEAQDTTIMGQKLIDILKKDNTRFIAVGDRRQSINAWCGADEDAFSSFRKYPNVTDINMHNSFRCPKAIGRYVLDLVPYFTVLPDAIEGEINKNVPPNAPQSGDMVLARFNAIGLLYYNHCLSINKKVYFSADKEYVDRLIKRITNTGKELLGVKLDIDGVFVRLYEAFFKEVEGYQKKFNTTIDDALSNEAIHNFYDDIKTLEILAQALTHTDDLIQKIKAIFSNNNGEGIRISTVHKAKGLEADTVYILGDSLMPSPLAHKAWQIQEEKNLQYVAYTRAKRSLNFIDEKAFPVDMFFSRKETLLKDLEVIKGIIQITLQEEYNKAKAKELRSGTTIEPPKKQITTRKVGGNKFNMFR